MSRSRISLTVDEDLRIWVARYFGEIEGDEINDSLMDHLIRIDQVWTYDSLIDMRRYDGTVLVGEIEELAHRWAEHAAGRDRGHFTAIVSTDPLVRARVPVTQSLFPTRNLAHFDNFDEGLEWLKRQRTYLNKASA
ncbi:MAG: hypothetical protein JF615_14595 [Asticcacaulis sp.]|nr:hypothetical protein [Asticcacaulis sp.]